MPNPFFRRAVVRRFHIQTRPFLPDEGPALFGVARIERPDGSVEEIPTVDEAGHSLYGESPEEVDDLLHDCIMRKWNQEARDEGLDV